MLLPKPRQRLQHLTIGNVCFHNEELSISIADDAQAHEHVSIHQSSARHQFLAVECLCVRRMLAAWQWRFCFRLLVLCLFTVFIRLIIHFYGLTGGLGDAITESRGDFMLLDRGANLKLVLQKGLRRER